jgi:Mn2+/Fe2+ NRAMP family transporter
MQFNKLIKILGPGLLYAGAAIGVSHLVQSTRAGAGYGFDLVWIVIVANVLKYPFFEFGPRYATITGCNLIDGYNRIGRWAIILFALLTVATMFPIVAAVTIVTAGLADNIFGLGSDPVRISFAIIVLTMLILLVGKYKFLDNFIKVIIILLAISTIVAVFSAMGKGFNPNAELSHHFSWTIKEDIFFLIALVGWMPAPIDVSIWHSLWTIEKNKSLGFKPKFSEIVVDFKTGFIGTAIMAVGFVTMGAYVMYGTGEELSSNGATFAGQLINMYTSGIGKWAYYFVAVAALTTMFSTTLTCLDAYPRVMKPITIIFFPKIAVKSTRIDWSFWFWIVIVASGALLLMTLLSSTMRVMVDIATTLSFVTAPLLAFLNYMVVTGKHMPDEGKPALWLRIYSWIGIAFLSGFTVFYVYHRFF